VEGEAGRVNLTRVEIGHAEQSHAHRSKLTSSDGLH